MLYLNYAPVTPSMATAENKLRNLSVLRLCRRKISNKPMND
ncbi:MAG: hypothetical protein ACLSTV_06580 [Coriobacteriales bacterium]